MLNVDELKDILVYLVYRCPLQHLPEYAIQKLIFLAEIESYKTTGKRLTEADYRSYNFGPYSQNVKDAYKQLKYDSRVECRYHTISNRSYIGLQAAQKQSEVPSLAKEKIQILEGICKTWGNKTPAQIVEHIYRTYIYACTPFDQYFEFEKIPKEFIDEKIDEDEVVNGEALQEEERRFMHLEDIPLPESVDAPNNN